MGAAASFDTGLAASLRGPNRYFCHSCHRTFALSERSDESTGFQCPHCQSSFLEQIDSNVYERVHMHSQLTFEQARRIANATAMLRLLESQLREELEMLQQAFEHANQRIQQGQEKPRVLTKIMKAKIRTGSMDLDTICCQPSCPICGEEYPVGVRAVKLPCSHWFHSDCVMPWLEMKQNCPICRNEISDNLPKQEELLEMSMEELEDRLRDLNVEVAEQKEKSELAELLLTKLQQYAETAAANTQPSSPSAIAIQAPQHLPFLTFAFRNRSSVHSSGSNSSGSSAASGFDVSADGGIVRLPRIILEESAGQESSNSSTST